jgi:hypothetical protein
MARGEDRLNHSEVQAMLAMQAMIPTPALRKNVL